METACGLRIFEWIIRYYLYVSKFQLFFLRFRSVPVVECNLRSRSFWVMEMNYSKAGGGKEFWIPFTACCRLERDIISQMNFSCLRLFPILKQKREQKRHRNRSLTSHISRKSCCSTRSNSHVVFVTTVLSRGMSCSTDSPNVAPTPRLQRVIGLYGHNDKREGIERIN